jgi:hypothetical protein
MTWMGRRMRKKMEIFGSKHENVRDKLEIVETLKLGQVIGVNTDWGS